jgi:ATP-dependent RNA helicase A
LKDLVRSAGIPEGCLAPHHFDFYGRDDKLDLLAALLGIGLYPNVCVHREKRIVLTTDMTRALICKTSVNCPIRGQEAMSVDGQLFPYPFFVYGEKVRTRAVSCKNMTLVAPLHVLMFGCKKVPRERF